MEISVDDLLFKGKPIGRFELEGFPKGRLAFAPPAHHQPGRQRDRRRALAQCATSMQTQVNLLMEISNAGKILARSGYPIQSKTAAAHCQPT